MNIQKTAPTPKLVTMIPADPQMTERDLRKKHLRVAPYCRVSTDKEEQLSSYEAQIEYYTEKIDANPDWTMVRLYADEGITGTSAKKRKDFLQMIRDCERGKIDLVITKSVSRFCRNTLDGLNYVRRLKRHGVGVYFEKENVNTLFMDNEMILTFMMSQAQAESESLSGNVRWGHRKNFKDGKVYYHCKTFLGYRWGADGQPEIDPEQAAVVRRIFSRFLLGHSVRQITTDLMADGIKTATGKTVWHDSVVQKMLCNEKYIGDAILQKTYIADLFTREKRVNNGELPKYYVHDCHPAIIDRETFQKVQEELARRSSLKKTSSKAKTQLGKYCGKYVLSELLVCGECGSPYRRVIWTQKGAKRVVWRCQNRLEHGRKICKQSPTLDEGDIHDAVISAMNELFRMQTAKDAVKAGIAAVLAGEEQTMSLPAVELQIRNLQERQLELFQLIGNELCLFRINGSRFLITALQNTGRGTARQLFFIQPVIHAFFPEQKHTHICAIGRGFAGNMQLLLKRVRATATADTGFLRFIQAVQQQHQKCHVITQRPPGGHAVPLVQRTAQTAVIAPVNIIFPKFQFRLINLHVSIHLCTLSSVLQIQYGTWGR